MAATIDGLTIAAPQESRTRKSRKEKTARFCRAVFILT
jgi:hypothetical protein